MRAEKQLLLDEIKQKIDASKGMIVTRYNRLPPNLSWDFRDKLAKSNSNFEVVKKRVLVKAAEESGIQLNESDLAGHIGVVFMQDEESFAAAKVLLKFSEENQDILQVVCGKVGGVIYGGPDMVQLARLPGIDEMRSQLIGLLVAPLSQMLSVLEAVMAEPLSVIEQKTQE
jgi:large subunit ribosomal protein L10